MPWPTRPVRVIVPYLPGGTADLVARILFEPVSRRLGQPFVIENRSGATGTIGAGAVAQAAPDGHTVLHDATGLSVTPALFPRLPYAPTRDFVPVFQAVTVPQLVLVPPFSKAQDIAASSRWRRRREVVSTAPRPATARSSTWCWSCSPERRAFR